MRRPLTLREAFEDRIEEKDGCWEWRGSRTPHGYGRLYWRGTRQTYAHRFAYELFVGPIPEGLQIDHLCRNRGCVNPAHLEAVTGQVNCLRGETFAAANAAKTHCKRGHEFTPENTYINRRGSRICKACQRLHEYKHRPLKGRDQFCKNGHPRTPENTAGKPGHRRCRECDRAYDREYKRRLRAIRKASA